MMGSNKDVLVVQNDEFNQAQDRSRAMKRRRSVSYRSQGRAGRCFVVWVGSWEATQWPCSEVRGGNPNRSPVLGDARWWRGR